MRGKNRRSGFNRVRGAMIAATLALSFGAGVEASHVRRQCPPVHRGPVVHVTAQLDTPRFLASRSTNFLATRNMNVLATRSTNVLAAPHQLAPKRSVVILAPSYRTSSSHVGRSAPLGVIRGNETGYASNRAPICRVVRTGSR